MSQLNKDVMVALDFSSKKEVMDFLDLFTEEKPFVKIGMELYYAEGPSIVREIKARGHKIFLDLKLHDIPNTVKKAIRIMAVGESLSVKNGVTERSDIAPLKSGRRKVGIRTH